MQKKLIALAVAGLVSGGAFAQTNVTLYGVADMYYAHGTASNAQGVTAINSGGLSGSRIGFKGTEDLGGGMSALFVLEYTLDMDNNNGIGGAAVGSNRARQQFVGLTGGFGTVAAGYFQTAGYDWKASTGPLAGTGLGPEDKLNVAGDVIGAYKLLDAGYAGRWGSAVAYMSPVFSGFSFAYNHARATEAGAVTKDGTVISTITPFTGDDASANLFYGKYVNGPLSLGAVYSKISMDATAADDDIKEMGFTGAYDFKVVKVFASHQSHKVGANPKNSKWSASVAAPVTAVGTAIFSYGSLSKDSTFGTAAKDNDDANAWTLAYTHGMSKRTTLYGGYMRVSNDDGGTTAALVKPAAGGSSSALIGGVRHTF